MSIHDLGNNIKKKIRVKDLKMKDILKLSPLYSICFNIIWLAFESMSAFAGFIPLHITSNGGDCVQHMGLYWCITYLYPQTSSSENHVASEPIREFSFLAFLVAIAAITVIFFIILAIVNKYTKYILISIGSVAAVTASVLGIRAAVKKYNNTPVELCSIQVVSADIHPGVYNSLEYPGNAYSLVPAGAEWNRYGYLDTTPIETGMDVTDVTREQLDALLDAVEVLREKRIYRYNGDFAFRLAITYKTRNGRQGTVFCQGYDEFPEEWADFARLVNEICGEDCLREEPELVIYSDEWFSENFGICEENLPEGASLAQFRDYKWIKNDMERICGYFNDHLSEYDAEKELNDYLGYLSRNAGN